MTSTQAEYSEDSTPALKAGKRWLVYALALSATLHVGAALFLIIAGGLNVGDGNANKIIFQELTFSPASRSRIVPTPEVTAATTPKSTSAATEETYEQKQSPDQSITSPGNTEKVTELMSTPLGQGMARGFFSSLADGRSLRDDVRGYYFDMVNTINREWWARAGVLKESLRQDGFVELHVQRDGNIASIRILQGTGSQEADKLLMEVIRSSAPFPALPATYESDLFRVPLRIKAPSMLFR